MRKLNTRLLLLTVAASLLVSAGTALAHYFQTGRIAAALLWQADRAEKEERAADAVKYLRRYLEFAQEDWDSRARLGRLLARDTLATNVSARENALFVLEQVLAHEPARNDLRPLVVRLAMDLKHWKLAGDHLEILHKAQPEDGAVEYLHGQWHEAQKQFAEAEAWYAKAVKHAPQQIDGYVRQAELIQRRLGKDRPGVRVKHAEEVLDQLVGSNSNAFQAYLARGRYRQQHGALDGARADARRALELAPREAEVLLAAAKVEEIAKKFDDARGHLRQALELFPADTRVYEALASVDLLDEMRPEALAWIRRGIQASTGVARTDLLWSLANVLLDGKDLAAGQAAIEELNQNNVAPAARDYLQARVLMLQDRWAEAARLLERTRPLVEILPELTRRVDLYLGHCYEQLHEPSLQLTAYNRALAFDPESLPARLGLASAQAAVGRADEAVNEYRRICELPDAPPRARLELARLLVLINLLRADADWRQVEDALRKAEEAKADATTVVLLRVEALAAQEKLDEATRLLQQARQKAPKDMALWTALATLAERRGQSADAQRLLQEAQNLGGDTVALRLARARFYLRRGEKVSCSPEELAELRRLSADVKRFSPEDQARLLSGLAETAFRLRDLPEAERLWSRLAELPRHANDVRLGLLLFDLALHAGDQKAIARRLADLERIEGSRGTLWRYAEATRLLWLAKQGKQADLDQARAHLDWVVTQRPSWPAALVAKADLEVLRGNAEPAIANYRKAVELGEASPQVIRQLVQLLYQRRRFAEADQEIGRLQKQTLVAANLQHLAADISLRNEDPARAVQLAHEAVAADSPDYQDHLWLGQILAASGRNQPEGPARTRVYQEAEEHLRRAVELGSQVPMTWVTLVRFLASVNRTGDAEALISRLSARLPAETAPLALAQSYEALGQTERAKKEYQSALQARPEDPLVLRCAAAYAMSSNRFAEAAPLLRKLLANREGKRPESAADAAWARHHLAVILASQGDYSKLQEALALVGLKLDPAGAVRDAEQVAEEPSSEELLTRAHVLALQPHQKLRARAIALLEQLQKRQSLSADDQYLLAQLHQESSPTKARTQLRDLVAAYPKNATYLYAYTQMLIVQGALVDAERALAKLEQMEQAGQASRSVSLRARLLEARGQGDKALDLVRQHVSRKDARPEEVLELVRYLVPQKRVAEAFTLCEQAWKTCPPEAVSAASLLLLRMSGAGVEDCRRVDGWFRAALEKKPDSTALRMHLADLQDLRGQFDEAELLYGQVLDREPRNVVALNNRAWLLALQPGKGPDALALVDQAMKILGPRPELLDTRATALLNQGQHERAVADLEQAVADGPTAIRYFHLARAYRAANHKDKAAAALRRARELGFQPERLHPLERSAGERLLAEIGHG
jgi:tetratricopeptide (TPR) repeat protein